MKLPAPYTTNASPYQKGAGAVCDAAKGAIGSSTAHAIDEATNARRSVVMYDDKLYSSQDARSQAQAQLSLRRRRYCGTSGGTNACAISSENQTETDARATGVAALLVREPHNETTRQPEHGAAAHRMSSAPVACVRVSRSLDRLNGRVSRRHRTGEPKSFDPNGVHHRRCAKRKNTD